MHNGNLMNLRKADATGKARWQVCGLASVPLRVDSLSLLLSLPLSLKSVKISLSEDLKNNED